MEDRHKSKINPLGVKNQNMSWAESKDAKPQRKNQKFGLSAYKAGISGESRRAGTMIWKNKANFRKTKMNVKSYYVTDYEDNRRFWHEKNKANLW